MPLDLPRKIAAFCREAEDGTLAALAVAEGRADLFQQVRQSLSQCPPDAVAEADLDALNELAEQRLGKGFYPAAGRAVRLPGHQEASGARYWKCPDDRCPGRGRVRPGQSPPFCSLSDTDLISEPLAP